jgi:hypothetical protein
MTKNYPRFSKTKKAREQSHVTTKGIFKTSNAKLQTIDERIPSMPGCLGLARGSLFPFE